jgi:hypothetical protein
MLSLARSYGIFVSVISDWLSVDDGMSVVARKRRVWPSASPITGSAAVTLARGRFSGLLRFARNDGAIRDRLSLRRGRLLHIPSFVRCARVG